MTDIHEVAFSDPDFAHIRTIRERVFIDEQSCPPDEEWDEHDATATHLLARRDGSPAGTLRHYDDHGWLRIGRLAVLPEHRGNGIAWALLTRCLDDAIAHGCDKAFLNAQTDKMGLYERAGFAATGNEFVEAGIPHQRMERFFTKPPKSN